MALYAKTKIRVQEVKNYMHEPALEEVTEERAKGVETKTQEEQRLVRNKEAKDAAQRKYEMKNKKWKESTASGLGNYRAKAILYMMLGPEGQRRYKNKLPHVDVEEDDIEFGDLWHMLDTAFHRQRNIIVARLALFSRRQEEGESLEQFHGVLQALTANCKPRDMEEELVRDLFITNMKDLELQKKFFVEEMDAETVLKTAIAGRAD